VEIDETNLKKELNKNLEKVSKEIANILEELDNKNYSISDNDLIQKLTDSKQEIDKIVAIEEE
tara:strand:- start:13 stop:201 length:189 start_codon:yes stop_codon:yes gene_type:complete